MAKLTMASAIRAAKKTCDWNPGKQPFSVDVGFVTRDGAPDETQFDLRSKNKEKELADLWKTMHDEFDADLNSVTYVFAYKTIQD